MDATPPAPAPEPGISRHELEAVIRRAAELAAADADAADRLSESEVLRIAADLGLPEPYVRRALLERPAWAADRSMLRRICGPATIIGSRTVPARPDQVLTRLEEYLTTREFFQPLRRRDSHVWLAPADDALSKIARGLSRPARRFALARARRLALAAARLDGERAHVRLEADLADQRRSIAATAAAVGACTGAAAGAALAATFGIAVAGPLGNAATAVGAAAVASTSLAGLAAGLGIARVRFRRRIAAFRLELEGLLDRLERGEPLDPPPAPWRRRLLAGLARQPHARR